MANAKKIFEELLLVEEKVKRVKKGLKIFYNIDIFIKEEPEVEAPSQEVTQPTQDTQQQVPQQVQPPLPQQPVNPQVRQENFFKASFKRYTLNEESIDKDNTGIIEVIDTEVENIQTIEDLIDFLSDKEKKNGQPVFNEFVSELCLTAVGVGSAELSDMLKKNDKVLVDIDYGSDKLDSIGFKVLKRSGVNNLSIMMKKDGNILPTKFDIESFNNILISFRNSIIGDNK